MTDLPPPPPPSFGAPPPASSPDVGAALSYGWKKFGENAGPLILAVIIPGVASFVFNAFQFVFDSVVLVLLFSLAGIVVNAALSIGIYRVALQITAGEKADLGKAFTYDRWGEWIVFSIVFGLMIGVGLILCVIPGLILLYLFALAPYFFLDKNMDFGSALTAAREASSTKQLGVPVLLCIIVGVLGIIACFIGLLVTVPLAYVAVAFLYRYAVDQPVAA